MTIKNKVDAIQTSLREMMHLSNALKQLQSKSNFQFRHALAGIVMEITNELERYNEARKPDDEIKDFQEQVKLARANNTTKVEGKDVVNYNSLMSEIKELQIKYSDAIKRADIIQDEAIKALDEQIVLHASPIKMSLIELVDKVEPFEASLLSVLLPFIYNDH